MIYEGYLKADSKNRGNIISLVTPRCRRIAKMFSSILDYIMAMAAAFTFPLFILSSMHSLNLQRKNCCFLKPIVSLSMENMLKIIALLLNNSLSLMGRSYTLKKL